MGLFTFIAEVIADRLEKSHNDVVRYNNNSRPEKLVWDHHSRANLTYSPDRKFHPDCIKVIASDFNGFKSNNEYHIDITSSDFRTLDYNIQQFIEYSERRDDIYVYEDIAKAIMDKHGSVMKPYYRSAFIGKLLSIEGCYYPLAWDF
jgi:hypothetical protein